MAETAAHLADHVLPRLPVRQWMLSLPQRLGYFLEREPRALGAVLQLLLRAVEAQLRQSSPAASPQARLGAVSFVHRFGASLNHHTHFHCGILDGVFERCDDGEVRFLQAARPRRRRSPPSPSALLRLPRALLEPSWADIVPP